MTQCVSNVRQPRLVAIGKLTIALFFLVDNAGLAGDPIEAAIKKGALYIQSQQLQDGCWQARGHQLGETALAGLALLAAGYPAESPPLVAAARSVRRLATVNLQTYEVALAVMFLDQLGERGDSELIRRLGSRLVQGQAANGSWTYSLAGSPGNGDNSNAQFAILACWICRRHGVAIENTILKADAYFRATVNRTDGGWGYTPSSHSTPTMSCAGLVALATERGMSIEHSRAGIGTAAMPATENRGSPRDLAPKKDDPVVAAALRYLAVQLRQDRITAQSKPFAGLYFYWSLERVGVIYALTEIDGVDWYDWGTARLLPMQRQDGSWGGEGCVDTAFTILFLSKQNLAEDLTDAIGRKHGGAELPSARDTNEILKIEKRPTQVEEGAKK